MVLVAVLPRRRPATNVDGSGCCVWPEEEDAEEEDVEEEDADEEDVDEEDVEEDGTDEEVVEEATGNEAVEDTLVSLVVFVVGVVFGAALKS